MSDCPLPCYPAIFELFFLGLIRRQLVGESSRGLTVVSGDRMGNRCLVGGAPLQVTCSDEQLRTTCIDKGDGAYTVQWFGNMAGRYILHITLDGAEVGGFISLETEAT